MFDALQWAELAIGACVGVVAIATAEGTRRRWPSARFDVLICWFVLVLAALQWRRGVGAVFRDGGWPLVVAIILVFPTAAAARSHARRFGMPLTLAVATITAGGIYVNVPDTELIALVGAGLGVLAVAWFLFGADRGWANGLWGSAVVVGALLVAGADGARGRPVAMWGVVGALGVVLIGSILRVRGPARVHPLVVLVIHAVIVAIVSRATIGRSAPQAMLIVGATLFAGALLLRASARWVVTSD